MLTFWKVWTMFLQPQHVKHSNMLLASWFINSVNKLNSEIFIWTLILHLQSGRLYKSTNTRDVVLHLMASIHRDN